MLDTRNVHAALKVQSALKQWAYFVAGNAERMTLGGGSGVGWCGGEAIIWLEWAKRTVDRKTQELKRN